MILCQKIAEKVGIADVTINAGIVHIGHVENTIAADFDKVYVVDIKGFYDCKRAVIIVMKDKGE